MKQTLFVLAGAWVAILSFGADPASAQANRTFVSGLGSDTNPCTLPSPCRSFAQAITQTNAGGEIAVLDTAGYGSVTINKAVSIINQDGVEAGITTSSATNGITIAAGFSDVINLRGLTLVGGGLGIDGIKFTSGGTLNIQNCAIRGFTNAGLYLQPSASSNFNVSDTIVSNDGAAGIFVEPTGSATTNTADFERVLAIGSNAGFLVQGGIGSGGTLLVTATDSAASGNAFGFTVLSAPGKVASTFTIVNGQVIGNVTGLESAGQNATMFLAQTVVTGNSAGFAAFNSGVLKTFGSNYIVDAGHTGNLTPVNQQ